MQAASSALSRPRTLGREPGAANDSTPGDHQPLFTLEFSDALAADTLFGLGSSTHHPSIYDDQATAAQSGEDPSAIAGASVPIVNDPSNVTQVASSHSQVLPASAQLLTEPTKSHGDVSGGASGDYNVVN